MPLARRIRPEEYQRLKQVRLNALRDAPKAFGSTFASESLLTEEVWRQRALSGATQAYGATWVIDDTAAGPFGGMVRLAPPEPPGALVELASLWVAAHFRGTGLAGDLVALLLAEARALGVSQVGLWVRCSNHRALRFYARLGFVSTGARAVDAWTPFRDELQMVFSIR